jgi:hypothetical protein
MKIELNQNKNRSKIKTIIIEILIKSLVVISDSKEC